MNGTVHQHSISTRLNQTEHLAAVRSILAVERTFLAYQRTALTELAVAATFIHFFDHPALTVIGWALVPASALTMALGVVRFRRMRTRIRLLEAQASQQESTQPPAAD